MRSLLFYFLGALVIFTSCDKDDDCVAGDLDTVIVGDWRVSVAGLNLGEVEFNANGTMIDENDALIGGEIGGDTLDQKSYTVVSNSLFTIRAQNATNSLESDVEVTDYTCDEIDIEIGGVGATLRRK